MLEDIAERLEVRVAPAHKGVSQFESRYVGLVMKIRYHLMLRVLSRYLADYLVISVHLPPESCVRGKAFRMSVIGFFISLTVGLGIPDFNLQETFWYTIHLLDLQ
jgi:hypothetical protein